METCIALIRGINVSGQKSLPMAQLRDLLTALGFRDVRTYIQSGNVVFNGDAQTPTSALQRQIAKAILQDFGYEVPVLVHPLTHFEAVERANPFLVEGASGLEPNPKQLHVVFLAERPDQAVIESLAAPPSGDDTFCAAGQEIYLHTPGGYGRTRLNNNFFERALSIAATTRNWNTVTKLCALGRAAREAL